MGANNWLRFAYSWGKLCFTRPRNGNTLKLKIIAKLKDIQTLIATVRDLLRTFATFPAPILSHYRLPLNCNVLCVMVRGLIRKKRQLRRFQDKEHLEDDVKMSWANCLFFWRPTYCISMPNIHHTWKLCNKIGTLVS